jgi:hypothetical protein
MRAPVSFDPAGLDLPGVPDQPPATTNGATASSAARRKPSPRPRPATTAAAAPAAAANEDDPNEWI